MAAVSAFLLALAAAFPHVQGGAGKGSSPLRFSQPLYNATIRENSAPRTYVETAEKMGVQVADRSWQIRYQVVSGDDEDLFLAEAVAVGDFSFLRVRTRGGDSALNREVRDAYALTVEAAETSSGLRAKARVLVRVLDANDLKPLFYPASYSVAVREDAPVGASVVRVSATDADAGSNADFYYLFPSRAHPFTVDPFTGTVRLARGLNRSRSDRFQLTVLAEDRTQKRSGVHKFGNVAKVTVTVQEAPGGGPGLTALEPVFSPDGTVAIDVRLAAGGGAVDSLRVVGGGLPGGFVAVPSGPDFQLLSTRRLNWSEAPLGLNLSLQAEGRSLPGFLSAPALVHVPPRPPAPLAFLQHTYAAALSEFSPPGSHVVTVSTAAAPRAAVFALRNTPDSRSFRICPGTGVIVSAATLDYEGRRRYELEVEANGGEAEARVVVEVTDENDHAPRFAAAAYEARLDENLPAGSSVLTVAAADRDGGSNGFVTFSIANPEPTPFAIDPFTGVVSTSDPLDFELAARRYRLRVWASDSGRPLRRVSESLVTVALNNLNDNAPRFERVDCNATLPPGAAPGQVVAQLSAVDADELQQLTFDLRAGNELRLFAIDPASGTLTLQQPLPPGAGPFALTVCASDGELRSEDSVVRVSVGDGPGEATVRCRETGAFQQLTLVAMGLSSM